MARTKSSPATYRAFRERQAVRRGQAKDLRSALDRLDKAVQDLDRTMAPRAIKAWDGIEIFSEEEQEDEPAGGRIMVTRDTQVTYKNLRMILVREMGKFTYEGVEPSAALAGEHGTVLVSKALQKVSTRLERTQEAEFTTIVKVLTRCVEDRISRNILRSNHFHTLLPNEILGQIMRLVGAEDRSHYHLKTLLSLSLVDKKLRSVALAELHSDIVIHKTPKVDKLLFLTAAGQLRPIQRLRFIELGGPAGAERVQGFLQTHVEQMVDVSGALRALEVQRITVDYSLFLKPELEGLKSLTLQDVNIPDHKTLMIPQLQLDALKLVNSDTAQLSISMIGSLIVSSCHSLRHLSLSTAPPPGLSFDNLKSLILPKPFSIEPLITLPASLHLLGISFDDTPLIRDLLPPAALRTLQLYFDYQQVALVHVRALREFMESAFCADVTRIELRTCGVWVVNADEWFEWDSLVEETMLDGRQEIVVIDNW